MSPFLLTIALALGADHGNANVAALAAPEVSVRTEVYPVLDVDPTPFGRTGWARLTVSDPNVQGRTLYLLIGTTVRVNGRVVTQAKDLAAQLTDRQGVSVIVEVDPMRADLVVSARFTAPTPAKAPVATKASKVASVLTGYPVRPSSSWWTGCSSWTHMTTSVHAGKFPSTWLQSLSSAELQSVHSDDHEGKVKWAYVPGRAASATQVATAGTVAASTSTYKPIYMICKAGDFDEGMGYVVLRDGDSDQRVLIDESTRVTISGVQSDFLSVYKRLENGFKDASVRSIPGQGRFADSVDFRILRTTAQAAVTTGNLASSSSEVVVPSYYQPTFSFPMRSTSSCPGGNCPSSSSSGRFRIFR